MQKFAPFIIKKSKITKENKFGKIENPGSVKERERERERAGNLGFFSIIKNDFFAFFIKFLPISAPVLFKKLTPSQMNLIKNAKNHFLSVKKFKKYRKCPALVLINPSMPNWYLCTSI